MTEKQMITRIKRLKLLQPNKRVLGEIKTDIYQQIDNKNGYQPSLSARFYQYGISVALFVLLFLFMFYALFPTQIHKLIISSKIAMASNRYEKAEIALSDITSQYNVHQDLRGNNISDLSQSLAFTNTEMSDLKLKGEPGKYTARQCHDLYQKYLNFLNQEYADVPTQQKSYSLLKSTIIAYREQAEEKLDKYPHM